VELSKFQRTRARSAVKTLAEAPRISLQEKWRGDVNLTDGFEMSLAQIASGINRCETSLSTFEEASGVSARSVCSRDC